MGALTYIGNAPNFMVRAIASQRGRARCPASSASCCGPLAILLPVFAVVTLVFFSGGLR